MHTDKINKAGCNGDVQVTIYSRIQPVCKLFLFELVGKLSAAVYGMLLYCLISAIHPFSSFKEIFLSEMNLFSEAYLLDKSLEVRVKTESNDFLFKPIKMGC